MALSQYLKGKVVREIPVQDIPDLFRKSGVNPDSEVFKVIQDGIKENNIDVDVILDTPISDLIEIFNLEKFVDESKLVRVRVVLRKSDFEKRDQIEISFSSVKDFKWDKICQLFEQEIEANDINQREIWYTYFEKQGTRGSNLPTLKLEKLTKELLLTGDQNENVKALLEKIQPQEQKGNSMSVNNAAVGLMAQGGSVSVGGSVFVAKNVQNS